VAEESTAASHSLASEAQTLNQLLGRFKIKSRAPRAASAPAIAHPTARPKESPARQMAGKVARAFSGRNGAAVAVANEWEDF
jgi:methyl-accepting chemotaxis protein